MLTEEKRHFKRYKKRSSFDLLIDGRSFKAETVDYSLSGMQVIVEDNPALKEGTILGINSSEPSINADAKVIWAKRSHSGLKIGLINIGDIKGSLADYPLADALTGLQRSNKTGILEVKSGEIIKKVYIKNGDMIFAASNRDEDRLGDILLRERRINKEQYDQSVEEMKRTKQRQGATLVRLGYLKPQELVRAMQHQVEEIIISLFALRDGFLKFKETPLPTEETITLRLSASSLIYRGIKRINVLIDIISVLPPMDSILRFSPDPLKLFQDISLDMDGKTILSYVDGKTALNYISFASTLDRLAALKTIYALLSTGIIEVVEERIKEAEVQEVTAEDIIEEVEAKVDAEIVNMIEDMHGKYKNIGYYGVLGIKPYAATADIKHAYYKAAKQFHPDRHFHLVSDDLKGKLSDIFAYITEAFATLSNPEKRRQYDSRLQGRGAKPVSNSELAQIKYKEGMIEFSKYNTSTALELFGQAAYLDSATARYHYYYGVTLGKLNRLKESVRAIERAINIEPSNADYLAEAGHMYLKLGFRSRAKSNFEEALKLSPAHPRAKEGMSLVEE